MKPWLSVRCRAACLLAIASAPTLSAAPSEVRLISSTSGARGTVQGGRYVISDPRTAFRLPEDRQIVVHFEWEGPPGDHECVALWKDPSGAVVLQSPARVSAKGQRFAVYWTITLADNVRAGLWAVEAIVDGQPAGIHTFQLDGPGTRAARLSLGELYSVAAKALVEVEGLGSRGQSLRSGAGFLVDGAHVITAFPLVEGATVVRLRTPGGGRVEVKELAAWSRRQGWAMVRLPELSGAVLPRSTAPLQIGDAAFLLDRGSDGGWVIVETRVVGASASDGAGRFNLSTAVSEGGVGGPLLDASGRVAAVLAGVPDPRQFRHLSLGFSGTAVVATSLTGIPVPAREALGTALAELARTGAFAQPLSEPRHVVSLTVAARVDRKGPVPMPIDQRDEFSRREGQAVLFITWDPKEKRDADVTVRFYDIENKLVSASKPLKMKLREGNYTVTSWPLQIELMPPGVYRIDVFIDDVPNARTFLRITE